jgi:hypothetical protein
MRKLHYYFAIALGCGMGVSAAQAQKTAVATNHNVFSTETPATPPAHRTCGTWDLMQQNFQDFPGLKEVYEQQMREVEAYEASGAYKTAGVITVPVVVHILYDNAADNIADSRVTEQIQVLNEDYSATNADASSVPSVWDALHIDTGIRFCLATTDPSGNPTTGINRISTTINNIGSTSSYYTEAPIWDRSRYLNIWVCEIGGGILGFATPPGTAPASRDGVVIDHSYFGKTGASYPFNKGRTASHEVGHWLGLNHIWADDPDCSPDEGISDTPVQADENYGAPTFPLTDACQTTSPGVMFMNYMDYVDDRAMFMFTAGQSARMNSVLGTTRGTIVFSTGCTGGGGGGSTACADTIFEPFMGTPALYTPTAPGWGYVAGHNNYGDVSKANLVKAADYGGRDSLLGVHMTFGAGTSAGPSSTYRLQVWDNDGASGAPGTVLYTQNLLYDDVISAAGEVYVTLTTPQVMSGDYYIGINFDYAAGDTLGLISDQDGETSPNIAWEEFGGGAGWYPFDDATNSWGISVKLAVFPIMSNCTAVGTEEVNPGSGALTLYPNPNTGLFNLECTLPNSDNASISVINVMGQEVYSHTLSGVRKGTFNTQIDLSNVAKGIYHVVVRNGDHQEVAKVVIR